MKHCYTRPVHNFARASSISLHELFTSQCNHSWAAKIFYLICIVFPDVAVNPHNLFRPGIPIRVKDFCTKRYDESWLLSINKNYDPNSQNKFKMYAYIKNVFAVENYVLALPMMKRRHNTKLRISSHRIAIETGRYTRPITPKNERLCNNCDQLIVGDEFHFLLAYHKFTSQRKTMFDKLSTFCSINNNNYVATSYKLMSYGCGDLEIVKIICQYVADTFTISS